MSTWIAIAFTIAIVGVVVWACCTDDAEPPEGDF